MDKIVEHLNNLSEKIISMENMDGPLDYLSIADIQVFEDHVVLSWTNHEAVRRDYELCGLTTEHYGLTMTYSDDNHHCVTAETIDGEIVLTTIDLSDEFPQYVKVWASELVDLFHDYCQECADEEISPTWKNTTHWLEVVAVVKEMMVNTGHLSETSPGVLQAPTPLAS